MKADAPAPAPTSTSVSTPQIIDLLSGCACAVTIILFVLFDAREAIRRRAFWFPGRVLILSALTIQLINYFDYSNVTQYPGKHVSGTDADAAALLKFQHVIDSGRVVVCVFIAYLLPGLVSSRFRDAWVDIGALALSVLAHVLYEFCFVSFLENETKWFKWFDAILFASLILLVVLSICAVFAGKSIRYIMDQKVPLVVSCCDPNSPRKCKNIEEHVLKCWIVVRSCQPDYIMARSVFSSLAGLVLTVCVVSMIVKWVCLKYHPDYFPLKRATFIFQFVFVLLGWIVVSLRWLTAVIFFPRDGVCSIFQIENFWTRSMIELKECLDGHSIGRMLREKINSKKRQVDMVDLIIALSLDHLLLAIGVCLQRFMVLLCKLSWFFSRVLILPLLVIISRKINPWSYSPNPWSYSLGSEFTNYRNVLEIIRMPGEMASSLWIANVLAFNQTKEHLEEGRTKTSTTNLRRVMELRLGSAADEARETPLGETSLEAKCSWKMRAVSLIHYMLCLYDTNNSQIVDDAIEACSQAWDLMDFVDNSDPEAHLMGRAADKKFYTLHNIWKQHLQPAESEVVQRLFTNQLKKDKDSGPFDNESRITVDRMQDSMDWTTDAVNISLYTTSQTIGLSKTVDNIGCLLENFIVNCLTKELQKALVKECSKWAENGMEQEIYHAAFIAGKAAAILLDQIGEANNVAAGEGAVLEASAEQPYDGRNEHTREDMESCIQVADGRNEHIREDMESCIQVADGINEDEEEDTGGEYTFVI